MTAAPAPISHLRAALLLLALLGNAIYALPLPAPVSRTEVEKDARQRDIALWQGWLSGAGIPVSHADLEDLVVESTAALGGLHKLLKHPFKPLFSLVGANQAWALFASATVKPERLVVEIEREPGSGWVPIERRLDPCCTWRDDQLRYRRIRGVWDGQQDAMRPGYRGLSRWVARQALRDHPDAWRMRIYLERTESHYPWEAPERPGEAEIRHERIHGWDAIFGPSR